MPFAMHVIGWTGCFLRASTSLPRVDFDRPFVLSYRVEAAGAPFKVTVFANFADEPTAKSAANKIRLRRDAVTP